MRLADREIEALQAGQAPLSVFEAQELARELPDWALHSDHLERTYTFPSFEQAVEFVLDVARLATQADHHPDIHLLHRKVRLELSTHKLGGLSANDFIVAAKVDAMALQPSG